VNRQAKAKHRHGPIHIAQEDPEAPGCCVTCRRPMSAANDRHVDQLPEVDPDITAAEARRLGEHD
jgi:hypothetical protein